MSNITYISNKDQNVAFLKNKKAIIFYSSEKCPACVDIKPLYERIAKRYSSRVSFSIIDIEEAGIKIEIIPVFEGYYNGDPRLHMEGVDTISLKQFIKKMINEK